MMKNEPEMIVDESQKKQFTTKAVVVQRLHCATRSAHKVTERQTSGEIGTVTLQAGLQSEVRKICIVRSRMIKITIIRVQQDFKAENVHF